MRVVVAMSGGVDSSTVAALLVEQGHDVIGLAMKTHDEQGNDAMRSNRACCTPDDMQDARRVADQLGIPFYVLNYADLFREVVIGPFAQAYKNGRTPNPCVVCNDKVKFRPMLERARLLGAERLATGHYARVVDGPDGKLLARGADRHKDQSYFLYRLNQEQLQELWFPLGELTKAEVRAEAHRLGLQVAEKAESQEICFVGAAGYGATVEQVAGPGRAGAIVDQAGTVLGQHRGVHLYTIGQRRGLGIAAEKPLYVTDIDADTGVLKVGDVNSLDVDRVTIEDVKWTGAAPSRGETILLQQRYRSKPSEVRIDTQNDGDRVNAAFIAPQPRGAPGQAAVFYRDDVVVGGGILSESAVGA